MFGLFKKNKQFDFVAPTNGEVMPITEVSDAMFAQKIMGDGYAVKPAEDAFYAPVAGTIQSIFPTKHALSFVTDDGIEVLLHLGVDTVELKGAPFEITVSEQQHVNAGDRLGSMDRQQITSSGRDDVLIVVFTNMDKINAMDAVETSSVNHGDVIGKVTVAG
ncbi:N-acetylglucosamine and glucose PTS, EIICBA [Lactobacillus selangorensis]|uniref:N-acetylglucosamine and glucose PTS, EIICBA n=1 Tax=Lactobacillus selangorensis TaxID=81857 RepID=A0A0R2G7N5_9LACO|nr:PTS glucose transporter subunit IIA [Lactobacillus selangorensis]KRN28921.1 N-acetylglucosamine and glucose PTS, EIICBA [Lactobacillus selangorensis]KRN32669.1 N-acetylglucosamine and glucose PTS, EIICBA [Lactobacillus selangorensis]